MLEAMGSLRQFRMQGKSGLKEWRRALNFGVGNKERVSGRTCANWKGNSLAKR